MDNPEIARIYIEVLKVLESKYRNKAGRDFERVFRKCRESLPFQNKEALQALNISMGTNINVKEICAEPPGNGKATETRLLLIASFNQIAFLLITAMKENFGTEFAEEGLEEMIGSLGNDDLKSFDKEAINYIKGNLDDFLNQLKTQ